MTRILIFTLAALAAQSGFVHAAAPDVATAPAKPAMEDEHDFHRHVKPSPTLSVADALAAALARAPEQSLSTTYREVAEDQSAVGSSLLASAPRLVMSYRDDSTQDDTGLREMEAGVEMDLWQWGEKNNAQQLADTSRQGSQAWQAYLQLQIAGDLREVLHMLALREARVENARQALVDARRLLEVSRKLQQSGSIARSAVMQSEALVITADRELLQEAAELAGAERRYHMLTGLEQRPLALVEEPPAQMAITLQHPQLRFLNNQRNRQQEIVTRERYRAGDNVTVALGVRRERGSFAEPDIDSLGLAVSIPFGGGSHRRAGATDAAIALADADVRLHRTQRQLTERLHEIRHQLEVLRDSMKLAQASRDLLQQHWQMAEKAFALGESDIQPTILALQRYRDSQFQVTALQLQQHRLISSFKQTVGELP